MALVETITRKQPLTAILINILYFSDCSHELTGDFGKFAASDLLERGLEPCIWNIRVKLDQKVKLTFYISDRWRDLKIKFWMLGKVCRDQPNIAKQKF